MPDFIDLNVKVADSIDFLIFWLDTKLIYINEELNVQQKDIKFVYKEMELFESYLYHGILGNIEKGELKNE